MQFHAIGYGAKNIRNLKKVLHYIILDFKKIHVRLIVILFLWQL